MYVTKVRKAAHSQQAKDVMSEKERQAKRAAEVS